MGQGQSKKALQQRVAALEAQLTQAQRQDYASLEEAHRKLQSDYAALQKAHEAALAAPAVQAAPASSIVNAAPAQPSASSIHAEAPLSSRNDVPKVGDHVLAYHQPTTAYYMATVVTFDLETYEYTVNWDDGDPSGRTMMYDRVALDLVPNATDVAEGSIVIFPQGHYVGTEGTNSGGTRYHRGVVTRVYKDASGITVYDGHHTETPEQGTKSRFRSYEYEFRGLKLHDMRLSPNVLNIIMNEQSRQGVKGTTSDTYDIFMTYSKSDSIEAIARGEVPNAHELPPPYDADASAHCDPRKIAQRLREAGFSVWLDCDQPPDFSYTDVVSAISNSKVIVACVSNAFASSTDNRQQFQFARDKLKKPIIPLVVENFQRGPPWDWQHTVVGMLLVSELYIDFTSAQDRDKDIQAVVDIVRKKLSDDSAKENQRVEQYTKAQSKSTEIFISYCWTNSWEASQEGQVAKLIGNKFQCPRTHAKKFKEGGREVWLDVWRLESGNEAAGMFEQIAQGLKNTKLVVVFVSTEYAKSDNCRMEIQFAAKSLRKPILPVIVGETDDWKETVVGMLISGLHVEPVSLINATNDHLTAEIVRRAQDMLSSQEGAGPQRAAHMHDLEEEAEEAASDDDYDGDENEEDNSAEPAARMRKQDRDEGARQFRAPRPGDHVYSYHTPTTCFYTSTIVSFNKETFEYTVNWDDGDPSGRTMRYDLVALDTPPDADDIAVGSIVIFHQGNYVGTQGNNEGGKRYHQGVVDRIYKGPNGETLYDGHHLLTPEEGKMRFRSYDYNFAGHPLEELRMSPNAMDALMACQEL